MRQALLLSGGIDSIALAYWKRPTLAITVNYGQKPFEGEARAAHAVATALGIEHRLIVCDLAHLGTGDLSDRPPVDIAPVTEWWPFRNQLLATVAGMACAGEQIDEISFGTVRSDAQHADGSLAFIQSIDALMKMQEGGIRVSAPAIDLSALELVRASGVPIEILAYSHSCHTASQACANCRGCNKHLEVMEALRGQYFI